MGQMDGKVGHNDIKEGHDVCRGAVPDSAAQGRAQASVTSLCDVWRVPKGEEAQKRCVIYACLILTA